MLDIRHGIFTFGNAMLKQISSLVALSTVAFSVQAFEKTQMDLQKDFWGTWSVYNTKTQCTETYKFSQPAKVVYRAKQKKMSGEFSFIRTQDAKQVDIFAMNISSDNKKLGCSGESADYSKVQIRLGLKWISAKTAELCTDIEAKQCLGLYLIKQQ